MAINEQAYLAANPDVAAAVAAGIFSSAADHFAQFGQYENRDMGAPAAQGAYNTAPITYNTIGGAYTAPARDSGQLPNAANANDPYDYMRWLDNDPDFDRNPLASQALDYFIYGNGQTYDHALTQAERDQYGAGNMISSYIMGADGQQFNADSYLASNPDVAAAVARGDFASAFDHYAQYGQYENRAYTPESKTATTPTARTTTPNITSNNGSNTVGNYREVSPYETLSGGDYDAFQKALYDSSTAGLAEKEKEWGEINDQSMQKRGIWSSGIAERADANLKEQLGDLYSKAGSDAAATRYSMQANDLANKNNYNLQTASAYNNYQLGYGNYTNSLQQINDSYALNRAQMLNDANAQASNAQWQAQWTPTNFLAGLWNGTSGTITNGTSGGGWNFMI